MRKEFSTSWISSSQPRKQRKYLHNMPLHLKNSLMSSHLSKELRLKYKMRNVPVRTGDEVLVMRGGSAKKKGKVIGVDLKKGRVKIEGLTRSKKDGSKVPILFRAHALQIVSLYMEDKKRLKHLNSKEEKKHASNKSTNA